MNAHLDGILSRLKKVRGRAGSWIACCPAHDDRNPSMTIRETPDGVVLMRCHTGCSIEEIAGALGVDMSDLFPPKPEPWKPAAKPLKARFLASDLLKAIHFETTIVALAAHEMAQGRALDAESMKRLHLAQERITEALNASGN